MIEEVITLSVRIPKHFLKDLITISNYYLCSPERVMVAGILAAVDSGVASLKDYKSCRRKCGILLNDSHTFRQHLSTASNYLPSEFDDMGTLYFDEDFASEEANK